MVGDMSILLKRWWFWAGIVILVFILWQQVTAWSVSRKLYDTVLNNLREDQSKVIRIMEENMEGYEQEIGRLSTELELIKKEKRILKAKADKSAAEVIRLKGEIDELQIQLQNISVSDDPDRIIDDLRRMGFGSIRRRR